MIKLLQHAANLGSNDTSNLHESKHEDGHWGGKLLWLADSIFHHVNSVSAVGEALPVKDKGREEESKAYNSAILVVLETSIECLKHQESEAESNLDDIHEESSEEDIDLIVLLESILLLVNLHEGHIRNGIKVSSELHTLNWGWLLATITGDRVLNEGLSLIHHIVWVTNSELDGRSNVCLLAWSIFILVKLLVEHEVFLPLKQLLIPQGPLDGHLEEDKEVEDDVEEEDGAPPDAVLLLEIDEGLDHEHVHT